MVAFPVPAVAPGNVTQFTLLHTAQLHVPGLAVIDTVALAGPAPALTTAPMVMVQPLCAGCAMTMPAPESRSIPGASMSIADAWSADRTCACVKPGFADLISAAMAAASGAAADVP